MERFIGNIDAKADVKGRVFIPAAFRKILQASGNQRLILRKDVFQDCLVLYPENVWNEELDRLRARLNRWDSEQQMVFRQFILDSEVLDIDSNGRVLLPKRYLVMAGISSEVRFVGMDYTIEVWAKDLLQECCLPPDLFKDSLEKWMK